MDPRHPCQTFNPGHPGQYFTDPCHPCHPRQSLIHATHEPTHSRYPHHPCYLADSADMCSQCGLVRFSAAMQLFKYSLLIPVSVLDFDFGLFVMNLIVTAEFDHCQYLRQTKKKDLEWRFEKRDKSSCSCIKVQNQVEKQV